MRFLIDAVIVNTLIAWFIKSCMLPSVEFQFREMPISLDFFREIFVQLLLKICKICTLSITIIAV